jgi:hypothetical protein
MPVHEVSAYEVPVHEMPAHEMPAMTYSEQDVKFCNSRVGNGSQINRRRTIVAKQNPESSLDFDSDVEVRLNLIGTRVLPEVDDESNGRVGDDFGAVEW